MVKLWGHIVPGLHAQICQTCVHEQSACSSKPWSVVRDWVCLLSVETRLWVAALTNL